MTIELSVFISSKMVELREEREALYALLPTLNTGMVTLRPWIFEQDAPASEKSIRDVYLSSLRQSALYLGLFWNDYGEWTIDEFERAGEWAIDRHLYVKDVEAERRDPRLNSFLSHHGSVSAGLTAKWFKTLDDLRKAVVHSIAVWVEDRLSKRSASEARIIKDPDDLYEIPKRLVGRAEVVGTIVEKLSDGGRVLLQAHGGAGKTALAAAVAEQWLEAQGAPVLWLHAGTSDTAALFEALARPFGAAKAVSGVQGDAQIQAMRQVLRESGATLLVLDDTWNGTALAALLKAVPRSLPLLVTARQRFEIDEIIEVGDLSESAAVELLTLHAGIKADADSSARDLCKALGYLAFAVEIGGKTLKRQKSTPAELLGNIRESPHLLEPLRAGDDPNRATVAALIESSLNALPDEAKRTFLAFGAFFAPTLTAEMLSLYLQPESSQSIEENLIALHDHGLAERIPQTETTIAYYRIHDLAFSYARALADESAHDKALEACLAYSEAHIQPTLETFAALRPELDNFMNAVDWAFSREKWDPVIQIATNLYGKSQFLALQGYNAKALKLLNQGVEAAIKQDDRDSHLKILNNLANAFTMLARFQDAIPLLERGLALSREFGIKITEIGALANLTAIYSELGQYDRVLEMTSPLLALARETGNHRAEAIALNYLGAVYSRIGPYEQGIVYFEQLLTLAKESQNSQFEAAALMGLGTCHQTLKKLTEAVDYYQHALKLVQATGYRDAEARAFNSLSGIYIDMKNYPSALENAKRANAIFVEIGQTERAAQTEQRIQEIHELMTTDQQDEK